VLDIAFKQWIMEELHCNRDHVTELLIICFQELRGMAEIIVAAT